jgi:FtsP/CotA-like multicopper oxidase with cupredoxin domain
MYSPLTLFAAATLVAALSSWPAQEIPRPIQASRGSAALFTAARKGRPDLNLQERIRPVHVGFQSSGSATRRRQGQTLRQNFAGPTWQSSDGSSVTATLVAKMDSPDARSIPWLLLNVSNHQGDGILARAKAIQRVNTKGGKPPASGCDADHLSQELRSPYCADYNFYAAK